MIILVVNAGSSSIKCCLFRIDQPPQEQPSQEAAAPLWQGSLDRKGNGELEYRVTTAAHQVKETRSGQLIEQLPDLLTSLWQGKQAVLESPSAIAAVGHRVVHGGDRYTASVVLTPTVYAGIETLSALAPLHNPLNLAGIDAVTQLLGDVAQVVVFDTAFHATLPAAAATYPLPESVRSQGIRRYGFHGTSHRYCAQRAATMLGQSQPNLINCHLGNGCSLAAIRAGVSVDTTMGFTPLDGLMMGSRSGALDPGILLYLMRQGMTVETLEQLLNKESGLLGVSGESSDLRQLLAANTDTAQLAIATFVHSIRRYLGAMTASLATVDAVIFTGGIGENAATIRAQVCANWPWLELDRDRNEANSGDRDIATSGSPTRILVIHTQEDWLIAQDCWQLLH